MRAPQASYGPCLKPAPVAPLVLPLSGPVVTLTHAEAERHIRGTVDAPVAAVVALSNVHATVEHSGPYSFPDSSRLFVGRPRLLFLRRGDTLRLHAMKGGMVALQVLVSNDREPWCAQANAPRTRAP